MSKISGVHTPAKLQNLAINGNFDFWQRVEAAVLSVSASSILAYASDMFPTQCAGPTNKVFSVARSTNVPTVAQSNWSSTYSYQFTVGTAITSLDTNDTVYPIEYRMEGLDYQKIHNKTVTWGFWFNTTIAGSYSFALGNGAGNRSYVTTFNATTGWQYIQITTPLDSGTTNWNFDNTLSLYASICCAAGSSTQTTTLNSWQNGFYIGTPGAVNIMSTAGATINIAQFSIVEGTLGFGAKGFARAGASIEAELEMCQRYYEKTYDIGTQVNSIAQVGQLTVGTAGNAGSHYFSPQFKVTKRTAPTVHVYNPVSAGESTYSWSGNPAQNAFSFGPGAAACAVDFTYVNGFTAHSFQYGGYGPGTLQFHYTADAGL